MFPYFVFNTTDNFKGFHSDPGIFIERHRRFVIHRIRQI